MYIRVNMHATECPVLAIPFIIQDGHGMSALHVACVKGRDECLRIMVEPAPGAKCQVDLEIKDKVI